LLKIKDPVGSLFLLLKNCKKSFFIDQLTFPSLYTSVTITVTFLLDLTTF